MSDLVEEPLLKGSFSIPLKNSQQSETHSYALFQNHLFFENLDKSFAIPLKKILQLNFSSSKLVCLLTVQTEQVSQILLKFSSADELEQFKKCLLQLRAPKNQIKNYNILQKLGVGSFSQVYSCQNKQTGQLFALKQVQYRKLQSYSNMREEVKQEIQILNELNHDNIVNLIETIQSKDYSFLVLDLCKGGDLLNRFAEQEGVMSEYEVRIIFKQLMEALKYIHSCGIMHRDIKMENILLKDLDSLEIKLADFGLSEYTISSDKENQYKQCGSMGYIAPEIFLNKPYDQQVDIFSAGVLMYGLLAGRQLFNSQNHENCALLNKEANIDLQLAKLKFEKKISNEGYELLRKMLKKDPKQRITAEDALKEKYLADVDQQMIEQKFPLKIV